jgi:hypothetical protein
VSVEQAEAALDLAKLAQKFEKAQEAYRQDPTPRKKAAYKALAEDLDATYVEYLAAFGPPEASASDAVAVIEPVEAKASAME